MTVLGVLGGGQLGRMLGLAGIPLGLDFRFLDPEPTACAQSVGELVVGDYSDTDALDRFLDGVDGVTYEFENVPASTAAYVAARVPLFPSPRSLEVAQDRLEEKRLFQALGIATARFQAVDTRTDLNAAIREIGVPSILKTRRFGYDGKGQVRIDSLDAVEPAWTELGGQALILEERVSFARELSIIASRGLDGQVAFYPLTENHHREGILRVSLAPAPGMTLDLQNMAARIGHAVLRELDHVGVLAIELFQVAGGFMANEIAPRVHNSGHWTIDGAVTSQFENHLRAILGLTLGDVATIGRSAMVNFIGDTPDLFELASIGGTHIHLYGKSSRAGRKVGHATLVGPDESSLMPKLAAIQRLISR